MLDEEYLAKAGIADPEATAPETVPSGAATPIENQIPASAGTTTTGSESVAPAGVETPVAKSAAQKAIEMFELAGQRFPVDTKFRIPHGEKVLEVPYATLINKFRQASHLEDKFKAFGEEQKSFAQMKAEADAAIAFKQKYGALQEWSEKNPKDWQTIYELYQNRQKHLLEAQTAASPQGTQGAIVGAQAQAPNLQPIVEKLSEYEQKLSKYDQMAEQFTAERTAAQERHDTEFVKTQISEFQKSYPEINLQERDPDGVALWAKIIQWGLQNKYTDFAPAADMFLKQRVHDVIASRARSEALKGLKTQNAQGIVKRSTTPFGLSNGKEVPSPRNIRNMSYAQLAELSKEQLSSAG